MNILRALKETFTLTEEQILEKYQTVEKTYTMIETLEQIEDPEELHKYLETIQINTERNLAITNEEEFIETFSEEEYESEPEPDRIQMDVVPMELGEGSGQNYEEDDYIGRRRTQSRTGYNYKNKNSIPKKYRPYDNPTREEDSILSDRF